MTACQWTIEELIPHRGNMLMIDEVISVDKNAMRCVATVGRNNLFLRHGELERSALPEYMAQTMAAFVGYWGRKSGSTAPEAGYLVGAQEIVFGEHSVREGDQLVIDIVQEAVMGAYGSYSGQVKVANAVVCQGVLKVIRASNATSSNKEVVP